MFKGYNSGPSSINNLASGNDGYNYDVPYSGGYNNKAPPSNVYGPV